MKRKYLVLLIVVAISLISVTGLSYAYFVVKLNSENVNNEIIESGTMSVSYTDGSQIGTPLNMLPGTSISKDFYVYNTGTLDTTYNIFMYVYKNSFTSKSDLVYTLTSDYGANVSETVCPDADGAIVRDVPILVGEEHHYTLTITFKDTGEDQNDNQGAIFSGKVNLRERENYETMKLTEKLNIVALDSPNEFISDDNYDSNRNRHDNNMRFVGANPSNYVYFNCSTTDPELMNDLNCERWRIIGLMNNINDSYYNLGSYVKIIREDSLGNYSWDTSSYNFGGGVNQWSNMRNVSYEGADLMRELNNDYLGTVTVGTDGKWYNGVNNNKNANMPTSVLNQNAKNMIQRVIWNTGADNSNIFSNEWSATQLYSWERGSISGKGSHGSNSNDPYYRDYSWSGFVGLMYASDYGYSTSGNSTTSRDTCNNLSLYQWYSGEGLNCRNNSWLYNSNYGQWTLSIANEAERADIVFSINNDGHVYKETTAFAYAVRPVVFLNNEVYISGGDGTSSSPYKLVNYDNNLFN